MAEKNGEDGRTSNDNEIRNAFPSVMPAFPSDIPSVIPNVFNRESRIFSKQGYMKEGTRENDAGFPLKTCGNDRRGTGGHDQRGTPAGMTERNPVGMTEEEPGTA